MEDPSPAGFLRPGDCLSFLSFNMRSSLTNPLSLPKADEPRARVEREYAAGMEGVRVDAGGSSEFHFTVRPLPGETGAAMVKRLARKLNAAEASVVRLLAFGCLKEFRATDAALKQALDDPDLPVTWVEGAARDRQSIAGLQVHAVSGLQVSTLEMDGQVVGRLWEDTVARHCVLGGITSPYRSTDPARQTSDAFLKICQCLTGTGMNPKHIARTWCFLDGILEWYGDFNLVRNDFFARNELRAGSVPASTGVGGSNPRGSALSLAAWAIVPHDESVKLVEVVPSPRQCPAPRYGSAFSRAVEIHSAGFRQLLVSGTASIAPGGETAHVGDIAAQIQLSMEVVGEILAARGMSFADVSRATAYFKSLDHAPQFDAWLAQHRLDSLPLIQTRCDVCRDDLLFEIEVDALKAGN